MTRPLVTCGITAYNAAATIEQAVVSALKQTLQPIEIICVDDCSTDGTRSILRQLAAAHRNVSFVEHKTNMGVAAARNTILEHALGDFVAFFDDDDESHPTRIHRQVHRLLQYEKDYARGDPVICHSARLQVYPDGRSIVCPTMGVFTDRRAPAGLDVAKHILMAKRISGGSGACATCSQLSRRSTYLSLNGFDPAFRRSEDTEFNVRLAEHHGHFAGIAEPLVCQLMTVSSEKRLQEEQEYALKLLDKHKDLFDSEGHYVFSRRWIIQKHAWLSGQRAKTAFGFTGLLLCNPVLTLRRLHAARQNATYNHEQRRFYGLAERMS